MESFSLYSKISSKISTRSSSVKGIFLKRKSISTVLLESNPTIFESIYPPLKINLSLYLLIDNFLKTLSKK